MRDSARPRRPALPAAEESRARPEVYAVVAGRDVQARLAAGLRPRADVHFVAALRDLLPSLAVSERLAGVVVEPRDAEGTPAAPAIARVRGAFPYTPVLLLCPVSPAAAPDILAAARAGASGLIVRDGGDTGSALVAALDAADDECFARLAAAQLGPVPQEARAALEFCLVNARRRLTVQDVADALGVHRKTLAARLARAGMPSPLALVGWCRLLLAARYVAEPGRPLERVAVQLDFPSAPALRAMLARYTGLTPAELRASGDGVAAVAAAWRRRRASHEIRAGTAAAPRRPLPDTASVISERPNAAVAPSELLVTDSPSS